MWTQLKLFSNLLSDFTIGPVQFHHHHFLFPWQFISVTAEQCLLNVKYKPNLAKNWNIKLSGGKFPLTLQACDCLV